MTIYLFNPQIIQNNTTNLLHKNLENPNPENLSLEDQSLKIFSSFPREIKELCHEYVNFSDAVSKFFCINYKRLGEYNPPFETRLQKIQQLKSPIRSLDLTGTDLHQSIMSRSLNSMISDLATLLPNLIELNLTRCVTQINRDNPLKFITEHFQKLEVLILNENRFDMKLTKEQELRWEERNLYPFPKTHLQLFFDTHLRPIVRLHILKILKLVKCTFSCVCSGYEPIPLDTNWIKDKARWLDGTRSTLCIIDNESEILNEVAILEEIQLGESQFIEIPPYLPIL